jgi:putative CocE/NonD family hydrolase
MLKTLALLALVSFSFAPLFAQSQQVIVEKNVEMKTRDGVTLKADVYRPAGDGPFPVLLTRTPYNKDNMAPIGQKGAARGFMVVTQDVRGRYSSEGEWYPFKFESQDGYETVEWAAALPHSNGKVGMFSGSYVGATQMLAAIAHPPHLGGICPIVTASNYHENWTYQGGAFEQWFNESWTSGLVQDTIARAARANPLGVLGAEPNAMKGANTLPLTSFPVLNIAKPVDGLAITHTYAPYFEDWLAHPTYDSYWKQWSIEENYANIQVPALTIAAWYDLFQDGSLRNYIGLRDHAGNDAARKGQHLLVIVGGHSGNSRKVGAVDFGPNAAFDENAAILDWYDYLFLGKQNEFANGKPVKIFVMGKNEWRYEDEWPLKRAKETRYSLFGLRSANGANGVPGDGALLEPGVLTRTGGSASDSFTYDPANPVPTVGGPLCCDPTHLPGGPRDQKEVEARPDVLVYSTGALNEDFEVTGPVTLDLFASSTAVDTDFTAKLVDVSPDGTAINLTEGILRASYRESTKGAPKPIVPGQIYEYKIDLWSTSNVFLKGHKIRLEVSSSNFPRFDRNLNTGKTAAESSEFVKATNTIYHDGAHPSALILPVVPQ